MATGLQRPPTPGWRPPKVLSTIIIVASLLFAVTPIVIGVGTDWLWFKEVHFTRVFTTVIFMRMALFFGVGIVAAAIVWLAGFLAFRYRPETLDTIELDSPVHAYRRTVERSLKTLLGAIPLVVGLIAGLAAQSAWSTVSLFLHRTTFGKADPQFGMDYGFYAFSLPLLKMVVGGASVLLAIAFFIALVGHYLLGGIRIGNRVAGVSGYVSTPARVQLAVTAGLWMLVRVAGFWLERFDLLDNTNPTFIGGSYSDIHAALPAKMLLMVIGAVVAVSFFAAVVMKDLRIPAMGTVLMVLAGVVIGSVWPGLVENFSVKPNRAEKEAEYIGRNIEATRYAFGLTDDKVTYIPNWGADGATPEAVSDDVATLNNIRLLDPKILSKTFTQQQQLKNFYGFPETLNMDRYVVDGELRDYVVAARELDPEELSGNQRDWINRHTVYTHGNGYIAAQANKVDEVARDVASARGGYPVYTVSDLQTMERQANDEKAEQLGIQATQPRVYFGPVIAGKDPRTDYAVVGDTGVGPVEYDTDTSNYTYEGSGGVPIGNLFYRTLFAARYQEMNLLLSDRIGADSKILFQRDPRTRVKKVAPWLNADSATYPAVIDGRIKWIVDGYTTLDSLPYSQRTSMTEATNDSRGTELPNNLIARNEIGYIRNSVKAVVDAYDGTVDLYEFDENDPVLKAWQGVFPGTVKPKSEISEELRAHLRYPEDMFKVQRKLLAKYHVDNPGTFFTGDAFWSVPKDPTSADEQREDNQPPYYVVAAHPETGKPSFQLISPFRGLNREFLAAHMTVSSEQEDYGKITLRVLPTSTVIQGPKQAQDTMMSSDTIARDRTLWKDSTTLRFGNLLTLPVGGGEILYVEPMYAERKGQESAFPKLLRVLVSYNGKVGYAPTIAEALNQVGIDPKAANDLQEADVVASPEVIDDKPANNQPATASGTAGEAIDEINKALTKLHDAKGKSFEEYGKAIDELDRAVANYQSIAANDSAAAKAESKSDKSEDKAKAEDNK